MRFFLLILFAVLFLVLLYYVTVIAHLFTGMFGKHIKFSLTLIPFYGWTKWFKNLD